MTPDRRPRKSRVYFENPPGPDSGFVIEKPERGGRKVVIHYDGRGLMSVEEAAEVLEVSKMTVYRWIEDGDTYARTVGGYLRIPHHEIKRLLYEDPRLDHEEE